MSEASKYYLDIVKSLKLKGHKWEDPDFKMDDTVNVTGDDENPVIKAAYWKRPGEIIENPTFDLSADTVDVDQGCSGDCFFLGAIAGLTSHKRLFSIIVPPGQTFEAGIFRFHFWEDGEYIEVLVDDRLPCIQEGGRFLLANATSPRGEFWASLLEKAFAKLKGGYSVINKGGFIEVSFQSLTGHEGSKESLKGYRNNPAKQKTLHSNLVRSVAAGALIGAGTDTTTKQRDDERIAMGLVVGHVYTILDAATVSTNEQLVYLRNPWGNAVQWKGAWGFDRNTSTKWDSVSDEEKKRLHHHVRPDGEFWMSMDDFVKQFEDVEVCMLNDAA